jgi:hypothetical protein
MRVLHASATDCPLPKFDIVTIGHGHLLALTILIGPDRSTTMRLPFASVPHTDIPDDVRDVGVGNERYDAVAPSGNGVGSEVDGGHSKSSRLEVSSSGGHPRVPSESPLCCKKPYIEELVWP